MPAGIYRINVEQGASFELDVTYTDSAGDPIDLTGYSGRGQIRLNAQSATTLASFTVAITNAAAGAVRISLAANALSGNANITGLAYNDYTSAVYDVELYTSADADVIRLLNGPCIISPEVTR